MRTLNRLIQTFHQSWSEKTLASLQLSTKKGEVSIKLELQFGRPDNIKPGLAAAGHPAGAPCRRQPRLEEKKGEERKEELVFWTSKAGARPGGGACQCWRRIPPPLLLLNPPNCPQEVNFVLTSPGAS